VTELVALTSLWASTLPVMESERERNARFGYALRMAIEARGTSARAVGGSIGVDPRKVSAWMRGDALPDVFQVQELARSLRVSLDLFQNPPEVPPPPPPYPLERYLLEAADSGAAEGHRRATTPQPPQGRGTPARTPGRSARAG